MAITFVNGGGWRVCACECTIAANPAWWPQEQADRAAGPPRYGGTGDRLRGRVQREVRFRRELQH